MRVAILCAIIAAVPVRADEGLWPYNQFPADAINQKHKFEAGAAFLDHLRLASVRLPGGSGAFVSPTGLIVTNQHLVESCIPDVKAGFYAAAAGAEKRCTGMDAAVLLKIEDVSEKVRGPGKGGTAAQALQQRNTAIAAIEKECGAKSGNRCTVVKLFSGGRYDLYEYKVFSDVRLVFAAEKDLAFFGRERDSLTYLRYGLDVAFLRAYENDRPAATPQFLKWSTNAVKEDDLVLASGNPAATNRVATAEQLQFYRDTSLPLAVQRLQRTIQQLGNFAGQSAEKRAAAEPLISSLLITYKLSAGKLIGLRDDRLVARKTAFQGKVRRAVQNDSKLGTEAAKVWDEVAKAYKEWAPFERQYQVLEAAPAPGSALFRAARQQVRGETVDPTGPVNAELETLLLTTYLQELQRFNERDGGLRNFLGGKTPAQVAESLVKSNEAMLQFVKQLDDPAQKLRKKHHDMIESLEASAAEKIAQYRFKLFGAADYPDATATPRVEFGVVKGYSDRAGVALPAIDTFSGLYYRKFNTGPYQVPQRWVDQKDGLDQVIALDFVSTCDIGGGDPGAAVVNRAGELVGVTFDGNLESLPDNFLYTDEQARAVHVAAQGIVEALRKVYKGSRILQELGVQPEL
jgi:hypothetical protein